MLRFLLGGLLVVLPVAAFAGGASPLWLLTIPFGVMVLGVAREGRDDPEARWEE